MFVYDNAGLILTFQKKNSNVSHFQSGNGFTSVKAAFQSSHIFMHAVLLYFKYNFYNFAKTLYSNDKLNPLSVCT